MSATGEDNHLVSPQKFSSGDYFLAYADGDSSVVSLLLYNPSSIYIPEAYMIYEDVFYTMIDGMLESMELKNGKICDDSDYICRGGT